MEDVLKKLSKERIVSFIGEAHGVISDKITGKVNSSHLYKLAIPEIEKFIVRLNAELDTRGKTEIVSQKVEEKLSESKVTLAVEPAPFTDPINGRYKPFTPNGKKNPPPKRYVYQYVEVGNGKTKEITPHQAIEILRKVVGNKEWSRRNMEIYGYYPLKDSAKRNGTGTTDVLHLEGRKFRITATPRD